MTPEHAAFRERLEESIPGVFATGRFLHDKGWGVDIMPTPRAPSAKEAPKYSDRGDLVAYKPGTPLGNPFEQRLFAVKKLRHFFTCAADWPFKELFITREHLVKQDLERGCKGWFLVSAGERHVAFISPDSKDHWYPRRGVRNPRSGNREDFTVCPMEYVKFMTITKAESRTIIDIANNFIAECRNSEFGSPMPAAATAITTICAMFLVQSQMTDKKSIESFIDGLGRQVPEVVADLLRQAAKPDQEPLQ